MTWRQKARAIIFPIVSRMHGEPRKKIRAALREAYAESYGFPCSGYPYRIWCEEVAYALHERTRKVKRPRPELKRERDVMPCMRGWARRQGLLAPKATLDVDLPV